MAGHEVGAGGGARVLLPTHTRPSKYLLDLDVCLNTFAVRGEERIQVVIGEATASIVLHSIDVQIESACIVRRGQPEGRALLVTADPEAQTIALALPDGAALEGGEAELQFRFLGQLQDSLCGFYRSTYEVQVGGGEGGAATTTEQRVMAVTQFEATDARRCFPCFDEPSLKAVFECSLTVPADRTAISNTPIAAEELLDGGARRRVRFAETPKMSTYLLAFIVGEFDHISGVAKMDDGQDVEIRVYTPLGKSHLGQHALDVSVRCLPFYRQKFGLPYPLPKLDLVACYDFAAGAMENWGCVTYRESRLLLDAQLSSRAHLIRSTRTVCHEIAHMWFGNLCTMQWWTHLWLNEGFARFMEHVAIDHLFPEWNIWQLFNGAVYDLALRLDSQPSTHPVEVEVSHPSEISQIFDAISYAKGSSIIRMLAAYLGAEKFDAGIRLYLKEHQYQNACTEDLWRCISQVAEEPVQDLMGVWTKVQGYPLVTVTDITAQSDDGDASAGRTFRLTQDPFRRTSAPTSCWSIPILVLSESGQTARFLFTEKSATFSLPGVGRDEWVKFNTGQQGFYRVLYGSELTRNLIRGIGRNQLSLSDRFGVWNDTFAMVIAGMLEATSVLEMFRAFKDEADYTILADMSKAALTLLEWYKEEDFVGLLRTFLADFFLPRAAALGWDRKEGEDSQHMMLRTAILPVLTQIQDQATIEAVLERFKARTLCADIRQGAYRMAVRFGGTAEYEQVLHIYHTAELGEEKRQALMALGCAQDAALVDRTLAWCFGGGVRYQDIAFPLDGLSDTAPAKTWAAFVAAWPALRDEATQGQSFVLANLVSAVTRGFKTEEQGVLFRDWLEANPIPAAQRTTDKVLHRLRAKLHSPTLLALRHQALKAFLTADAGVAGEDQPMEEAAA